MSLVQARSRILAMVALACAAGACSGGPADPHGSPILEQVYWSAGGSKVLVWTRADNPSSALVSPVAPFASEVDFVFDRRLDGARLEDLVTVDGVTTAVPKEPAAVRASWPGMTADPPFKLVVDYNSSAFYGGQSSYVFARPDVPGFPSDTTVSFQFLPGLITSAYGDLADLPESVPVKTAPLSVAIGVTAATILPAYQIPLAFSNRLSAAPATSPFIHVTLNGVAVPYELLTDAGLASRWYLTAASCLGAWPASATLLITIDGGFADAFGGTLGQAVSQPFTTSASSGTPVPPTCPLPDAGAPDAGVDARDGAAPDGGAPDQPVDAGTAPSGGDASAADAS